MVENRRFEHTPHVFSTSVWGDVVGISPRFLASETRVTGLSYGVVCVILGLAIFVALRLVTDRRIDRQTDGHTVQLYRASIPSRGTMYCMMQNCIPTLSYVFLAI